jgi:glycosyltransferase involved in cell wall biosynthesis
MDISSKFPESGSEPSLSVVIGIRNWGLDRLEVALKSHLASDVPNLEIIVSDYGSTNCDHVSEIAKKFGCKYIFSESDVWSRSAALNAGIIEASSNYILTTDADIIFSPKSHGILIHNLECIPDSVQIIQCRDLPDGFGSASLSRFDWDQLFKVSAIRPRWGMGGSATFTKALFSRLHGFDERMTVWGGEDNDFVQRARRSGAILNWIENPEARIYHIWHPPDSRGASQSEAKVVENNKKLLDEDFTVVRNLSRSFRRSHSSVPTVSVVIATRNRPELLRECVRSCLEQTFQDFEIIVVDDGSDKALRPRLDEFDDERLRVIQLEESRGIAYARNQATRLARGEYIAIQDEEDLMLPQRLEHQLGAIAHDFAGTYGGWIAFDDQSGALTPTPGWKAFDLPSMMFGRAPAHGGTLIRRRVLDHYHYNETFQTGSSFHLLNRIARGGIRLAHCGHYVILRRLHPHDHAGPDSLAQKSTSTISKAMARAAVSANLEQQYRKAARANPKMQIAFSEVIDASQHLPPHLLSERVQIEFCSPLPAVGGTTDILRSVLAECRPINFEFNKGHQGGLKAVTVACESDKDRNEIISMFSGIGEIQHVRNFVLPRAHADLSRIEAYFERTDIGDGDYVSVGNDIEGLLRTLGKHCSRCFLAATGEAEYRLGLPPLEAPVRALVHAKIGRFRTDSRHVSEA